MTRSYLRTAALLGCMAMCMAAPNDAGAARAKKPPADPAPGANAHGIGPDIGEVSNSDPLPEGAVEVTAASKLDALQKERDVLADDLVRLGDYLHANGFLLEIDGFPVNTVDIAIHHLQLKKGYESSLEGAALALTHLQTQIDKLSNHILDVAPDAIEGGAVDTAIKLIDDRKELQLALETHQAKAKCEADEDLPLTVAGADISPATRLAHPVEEIEGLINTHFRSGGDAVIELHNATGRLKAAVRQVKLIEEATANQAA